MPVLLPLPQHLRTLVCALLALAAALALPAPGRAAPEARLALVATGAVNGVYFPVGVALCRLPNQERRQHGLRCSAQPSEGSVANIGALRDGEVAFAIVQSDAEAAAVAGTGAFAAAGPFPELKSVMALYPEPLAIVARADAGIATLADLAGKRVALGPEGSGTREIAAALVAGLGWSPEAVAAAPAMPVGALGPSLCAGEIDAFAYAVGQPAQAIQATANNCDVVLVPVEGPAVAALVEANPALATATIPGGLYRGNAAPVASFGSVATLVTRSDEPEDVVRLVLGAVLDDFDTFSSLHPALSGLAAQDAARAKELHPAAEAVYRERDLLP